MKNTKYKAGDDFKEQDLIDEGYTNDYFDALVSCKDKKKVMHVIEDDAGNRWYKAVYKKDCFQKEHDIFPW